MLMRYAMIRGPFALWWSGYIVRDAAGTPVLSEGRRSRRERFLQTPTGEERLQIVELGFWKIRYQLRRHDELVASLDRVGLLRKPIVIKRRGKGAVVAREGLLSRELVFRGTDDRLVARMVWSPLGSPSLDLENVADPEVYFAVWLTIQRLRKRTAIPFAFLAILSSLL
jgi:hypothetical protein